MSNKSLNELRRKILSQIESDEMDEDIETLNEKSSSDKVVDKIVDKLADDKDNDSDDKDDDEDDSDDKDDDDKDDNDEEDDEDEKMSGPKDKVTVKEDAVEELLVNITENNSAANDIFSSIIMEKIHVKLEEMKKEVSSKLIG